MSGGETFHQADVRQVSVTRSGPSSQCHQQDWLGSLSPGLETGESTEIVLGAQHMPGRKMFCVDPIHRSLSRLP